MASCMLGVCLYYVKHQVIGVEKEIKMLRQKSFEAKESIHILKAEWGFLNDPKRLQELNDRYVHLHPVKTHQIASLDSLGEGRDNKIMMARLERKR